MCRNFCLEHFCISRDANKIASHAIKQFLQVVHHLRCRSYASYAKKVTVGQIINQLISRKNADKILYSPLPLTLDV